MSTEEDWRDLAAVVFSHPEPGPARQGNAVGANHVAREGGNVQRPAQPAVTGVEFMEHVFGQWHGQ